MLAYTMVPWSVLAVYHIALGVFQTVAPRYAACAFHAGDHVFNAFDRGISVLIARYQNYQSLTHQSDIPLTPAQALRDVGNWLGSDAVWLARTLSRVSLKLRRYAWRSNVTCMPNQVGTGAEMQTQSHDAHATEIEDIEVDPPLPSEVEMSAPPDDVDATEIEETDSDFPPAMEIEDIQVGSLPFSEQPTGGRGYNRTTGTLFWTTELFKKLQNKMSFTNWELVDPTIADTGHCTRDTLRYVHAREASGESPAWITDLPSGVREGAVITLVKRLADEMGAPVGLAALDVKGVNNRIQDVKMTHLIPAPQGTPTVLMLRRAQQVTHTVFAQWHAAKSYGWERTTHDNWDSESEDDTPAPPMIGEPSSSGSLPTAPPPVVVLAPPHRTVRAKGKWRATSPRVIIDKPTVKEMAVPRATKRPRKESTHKITPAQAAELDAVEKESVRKARLITIGRGRKRVTLEGEGGESDAEEEFDPLALYALTGAVLSTKLRVASRRTDNGTENHTVVANGPVAWTAVPRPPHDYIDPSERYTCVGEPPKDIVIFEEVDGRLISEKILELMRSAVSGTVPTETTLSGWVRIFSAAWQKEWWELPAFSRAAYRTLSPNTVVQPTLIRVIENHVASTTNELLPMAERLNSGVPSALDDMRTAVGLTSHAPHLATSVVSALPKSMQTVLRSDPHLDRVKTPLTLFTSMARLYDARNGTAFNQVVTAGLNSFQNLMDMCLNTRTGARLDRCPHGRARPKCSLCQIVAEATTNYLSMGTHLPLYEARLSTRASIFAGTPQPEWKDIAAGVRWEDGVGPIDLFRPAAHLIGIGNIAQLPVPVAANATNLTTALRNRFIHDIPLHDPKVWQKFEEFVEHNRERLLPGLKPQPPIPFEQWVSNFPPYKRERLRKANLRLTPILPGAQK